MAEQIGDVLVDAIVSLLTQRLQTEIDPQDPTYVSHVQGGRLQANPVPNVNSVMVHIGDPEDTGDGWIDEVARPDDPYVSVPAIAEIGGGFTGFCWWRRGTVQAECFYIANAAQHDRDEARQYANVIKARIEQALGETTNSLIGLSDSEGREMVLAIMPVKSRAREAGGPSQHVWHVKVWWQALTTRQ